MDKAKILGLLQPFTNTKNVLVDDQSTNDIIKGILATHNQYKNEYAKIYKYFIGNSDVETFENIYNFLADNVKYYIEPGNKQTLRSPAAILKSKIGVDCKSYALFCCGILSAYKLAENKNFDVYFRFAGYGSKNIEHVFCVVKNKNKTWFIDNVLPNFDDRSKQPIFYKDFKASKDMALIQVSGIKQDWRGFGKRSESVGNVPKIFGLTDIDFKKLQLQISEIIDFFKNLNLSDGEKMKLGFVRQGFTPDEMLMWYIVNKPDDWAFLHQAKEILIWDTPNISYNVADAFNTLIDKPQWANVNAQYQVPFDLSLTNKTPVFLESKYRGKNYVAPATTPSGSGTTDPTPTTTKKALPIAAALLLAYKIFN